MSILQRLKNYKEDISIESSEHPENTTQEEQFMIRSSVLERWNDTQSQMPRGRKYRED